MGDFNAELPLYIKSSVLTQFVTDSTWMKSHKYRNILHAMESLWIELYERGYIELDDVMNVQKWLKALCDIGYKFPSLNDEYQNIESQHYSDSKFTNPTFVETSYQQSKDGLKTRSPFECAPMNVTYGFADLHRGTKALIASSISHANQNIVILKDRWPGMGSNTDWYPEIMKMPGVSTYYSIEQQSKTLRNYPRPWKPFPLTSEMIKENYNFYKDDKTVNGIDAFICTFPASMCEMWMSFKKAKIVYMAAHR